MKSRNVLFSRCLSRDHIGHDVVDLDTSKLLSAKQKLIQHQSICEAQLTRCKDAYLKSVADKLDEMMKQVSNTTKQEISSIDQEVSAIAERLNVVNGVSNGGKDSPKIFISSEKQSDEDRHVQTDFDYKIDWRKELQIFRLS